MSRWLVTGGAGYIGSHVARALLESGRDVTVLDDLSSGHRLFVPDGATFIDGSLLDDDATCSALDDGVDGVIHLAGFKYAGESVRRPLHTYQQNVIGTMKILGAMRAHGVSRIVFSSSAGVYGTPAVERVTELTPPAPESPYGESKLVGEWLIRDEQTRCASEGSQFSAVALRYFNVIGSGDPSVRDTSPHNLIPKVLAALRDGDRPRINGTDYPTPDGTCVRDYVHVHDVAAAHVAAAVRLENNQPIEAVYNLGSGDGASVRQVVSAIIAAAGSSVIPEDAARRPGDPARIVADNALAVRDLNWPTRHSIERMVTSAVEAERYAQRRG